MSCNHTWSEECYDVVPSQVCVRCNAFEVEEEHERLRADRDKWRDRYHAMRADVGLSGDIEDEIAVAYRRGAEAMRRRCAMWIKHNSHEDGLGMGSQRIESALAALPIPEEW